MLPTRMRWVWQEKVTTLSQDWRGGVSGRLAQRFIKMTWEMWRHGPPLDRNRLTQVDL